MLVSTDVVGPEGSYHLTCMEGREWKPNTSIYSHHVVTTGNLNLPRYVLLCRACSKPKERLYADLWSERL